MVNSRPSVGGISLLVNEMARRTGRFPQLVDPRSGVKREGFARISPAGGRVGRAIDPPWFVSKRSSGRYPVERVNRDEQNAQHIAPLPALLSTDLLPSAFDLAAPGLGSQRASS